MGELWDYGRVKDVTDARYVVIHDRPRFRWGSLAWCSINVCALAWVGFTQVTEPFDTALLVIVTALQWPIISGLAWLGTALQERTSEAEAEALRRRVLRADD